METGITIIMIIITSISWFISGYKIGYESRNSAECAAYVQESSYQK